MEASPFDHHAEGAADLSGERFELWRVLAGAGGEPVSYESLEAKGFRHPAMLVYELESAGHHVERVFVTPVDGRRRVAGARLLPDAAPPARRAVRRPFRARLRPGRRVETAVEQPPA